MSNEELIQNQEEEVQSSPDAEVAEKMIEDALHQMRSAPKENKEEEHKQEEKPKGYDRVDVSDPKIKDRIDYLYKQVKASDETNRVVRSEYQKVAQALEYATRELEELKSRQVKNDEDARLQHLRGEMKRARELGDDDAADKFSELIAEFKAEQKISQRDAENNKRYQEYQASQRQQQQQQPFSQEEVEYANSLKDELAEDGSPLRPWMRADDKDFKVAQLLAAEIVTEKKLPLKEALQELDRLMFEKRGIAPKKNTPKSPEVLSGLNLTAPPKSNQIKLTDAEKFAARKLNVTAEAYAKSKAMAEKYTRVSIDDF